MGIPRFSTRLKAYAQRSTLGSTGAPKKNAVAIIDGPGLAHYIYQRYCEQNPNIARIHYAAIAQAVADWLAALQCIGYRIEAILFDGALPASKKDIRIKRLQDYIAKVQTYKKNVGSAPLTLAAKKSLPPPTFLVFSVVEELLANPTCAGVTYIVPGEADPYCVAAAQSICSSGSQDMVTIFSDDADLLVYELDLHTCVAPFRDLSISSSDTAPSTWTGDLYWPLQMAQRGNKTSKDLIQPAYFMAQDSHRTLVEAFRMRVPSDQHDFAEFASEFTISAEVSSLWSHIKTNSGTKRRQAMQDSRISEFIWQCNNDADGGLRMFLPFLIDDPSRATAWGVGAEVRKLAYCLVKQATEIDADVQEYRRSGARLVSTLVESQTGTELILQVDELNAYLEGLTSWARKEAKMLDGHIWRYMVLQQTLKHLHHDGHTLPQVDDLIRVVANQEERKWRHIHLSAQYQAAYYSVRMLKQVLRHVMLTSKMKTDLEQRSIEELWRHLADLPTISEFLSLAEADDKEKQQWRTLLSDMLVTLKGNEEDEPESKRRKTSKKEKRKKNVDSKTGSSLAMNPFAMLADE